MANANKDFGSDQGFLLIVILAVILQVFFGYISGGRLSEFFPDSVIKGMLFAIVLIIILKQIPHALGGDADYEGEIEFEQVFDNQNTITEFIRSFVNFEFKCCG